MNVGEIVLKYWQPACLSFFLTLVFVFIALKLFPKLGLMDRPGKYGLNRSSIPYYGGLVIFLAFMICVLVFVPMTKTLIGLLGGASLIMILGFLDDYFGLNPFIRLFVQFVACLVLVFFGIGILSINIPFLGTISFVQFLIFGIPVLSLLFTVFWVMMVLNTMNFVDGVGGLSSGVAFVAGITLFLLSIHPGMHSDPSSQVSVATISLILAMVALAFLIFDFPKSKILMGDTGSTFLGFVIATLAIFSGGKVATAFLVLGIPILDMVWVVLRRTFSKKPFWKGDLLHLHHRLLNIGFSERKVVLIYLLVTAFFGLSAVSFVSSQQKFFMLIGLIVMMSLLVVALIFVPKKK